MVIFLLGILSQVFQLPCVSKWPSYRTNYFKYMYYLFKYVQKVFFTYFLYYLWHAVSFLLSCRNEIIDQIFSTLFFVLVYLRLQPPVLSLFLAHLCHDKKFKQVVHSVLLSVVKSYSPDMDLIKVLKKYLCHITLVVVLLMRCSEKLMLFKLENTVSFPSSVSHSQFRLAITSTHVYKKIPTALKC